MTRLRTAGGLDHQDFLPMSSFASDAQSALIRHSVLRAGFAGANERRGWDNPGVASPPGRPQRVNGAGHRR